MNNTENAELCEGIAQELTEHGHCTGKYWDSEGRMCLLGAGLKVLRGVHGADISLLGVPENQEVARALGFDSPTGVVLLNDGVFSISPGLTQDTAIEYANNRAKFWREQG